MHYDRFGRLPEEIEEKTVAAIEAGILAEAVHKAKSLNVLNIWDLPEFVEIYSHVGYSVVVNLDIDSSINQNDSNEIKCYLIERVVNFAEGVPDGINPKDLGKMSPSELNPHINKDIIEQLKIRGEQVVKIKYSTMYKCDKCGAKKAKEREIQTRSLDEGKTLFIECVQCGHTWRKYG